MKKKIAVLSAVFVAALVGVVIVVASGGGSDVCGQDDGPPYGAKTPNAQQLAEWPAERDKMNAQAEERGNTAGEGEIWPPPPTVDYSDYTEQNWTFDSDPQGGPPGTGESSGGLVALVNPCV